jgi:hypothetical protein
MCLIGQHTYEGTRVFSKDRKQGLFFNFGESTCSRILIRIPIFNTDPDQNPERLNECRSMRIWIQIHNTAKNIPTKMQIRIQIQFSILDPRTRGQKCTVSCIPDLIPGSRSEPLDNIPCILIKGEFQY